MYHPISSQSIRHLILHFLGDFLCCLSDMAVCVGRAVIQSPGSYLAATKFLAASKSGCQVTGRQQCWRPVLRLPACRPPGFWYPSMPAAGVLVTARQLPGSYTPATILPTDMLMTSRPRLVRHECSILSDILSDIFSGSPESWQGWQRARREGGSRAKGFGWLGAQMSSAWASSLPQGSSS